MAKARFLSISICRQAKDMAQKFKKLYFHLYIMEITISFHFLYLRYFYFLGSKLHPNFSPKINHASAIVPNAKMVSPITRNHLNVTR